MSGFARLLTAKKQGSETVLKMAALGRSRAMRPSFFPYDILIAP